MTRSSAPSRLLRPAPFLTVLLAVLCLCLSLPAHRTQAQAPFDPFTSATIDTPEGAAAPGQAAFVDRMGQPVDLGTLVRGDVPVVLAPVYFTCPNICGVSTGSLLRGLGMIDLEPGRDYRVVFFSFDPTEGPPDAREALAQARKAAPEVAGLDDMRFLSSGEEPIRAVTQAVGYHFAWDDQLQQYSHANAFAVLTPDGRVSRWINAVAAEPTDLRLAIVEAGGGAVGDLGDFLLMLCYQYDPETGKYGSLINGSLKGLAGLTVAGLAGFIGLSLWREKRGKGRS